MLLDFFEDLTNGSEKILNEITQIYEKSKKSKVEGHKDKKNNEKVADKIEKHENEEKSMDVEESKKEENNLPTVDEDGFILVKKKGKK